ncbi:MAG: SNF2-related protein [Deltaproteobacteria bacterium]|jgi:predicted nucleic acid-binding Zn finger protein|nr:SNF2-related protein [Deltaproteobacteria bacterium]
MSTILENKRKIQLESREAKGNLYEFPIENLKDEHPFFSLFKIKSNTYLSYFVEINSLLKDNNNFCTCKDYKYNHLGTCKHIEAVLNQLETNSTQAFNWTRQKQPRVKDRLYVVWIEGQEKLRLSLEPEKSTPLMEDLFVDGCLRDLELLNDEKMELFLKQCEQNNITISWAAKLAMERWKRRRRSRRILQQYISIHLNQGMLKKKIKEHQVAAVKHLLSHDVSLLSGDYGTGKRVSVIGAIYLLQKLNKKNKTVIITDKAFFSHWKRLFKLFFPQLIHIFGEKRTRNSLDPFKVKSVFLADYENLLRDGQNIQKLNPDLIVYDEIQDIKNWTGMMGKLIKSLESDFQFILSSISSRDFHPQLLVNLAQFINSVGFGPMWLYLQKKCKRDRWGKVVEYGELDKLQQMIKPFNIDESGSDTLPGKSKIRVIFPMTKVQQDYMNEKLTKFAALVGGRFNWKESDVEKTRSAIRKVRLGLGDVKQIVPESDSTPKQVQLKKILKNLGKNNKKTIIFTAWEQFDEPLDQIINDLGLKTKVLITDHQARQWSEEDSNLVGIIHDKNFDFRINNVDAVINYDMPWNKKLIQNRRKLLTKGKDRLIDFIFVVADSIEERAMVVLSTLPNLIDEWFDEEQPLEALPEPEKFRNMVRKLSARRDSRISSSKVISGSRRKRRSSKIVGLANKKSKVKFLDSNIRSKVFKTNSIVYKPQYDFPDVKNKIVFIDLKTVMISDERIPVFAAINNTEDEKFWGFTAGYFDLLGQELREAELVVSLNSRGNEPDLFFPGSSEIKILDLGKILREKTSEPEVKVKSIIDSTLSTRYGWEQKEITRLFKASRYNDLIELAQSDLKTLWRFLSYMVREDRFFYRLRDERQSSRFDIKKVLPEEVISLLQTRREL